METSNMAQVEKEKEKSKFDMIEDASKENDSVITEIFGILSSFEDKLGENSNSMQDASEKNPEPSSRLVRLNDKLCSTKMDLSEIANRLRNLSSSF